MGPVSAGAQNRADEAGLTWEGELGSPLRGGWLTVRMYGRRLGSPLREEGDGEA